MQLRLDHVGLPVRPADLEVVAHGLVKYFGATHARMGESATRSAIWLEVSGVEVHLISNDETPTPIDGQTFSPHLSFVVDNLASVRTRIENNGVSFWEAGTLPQRRQLWVLLAPSFVVEVQEVPGRAR